MIWRLYEDCRLNKSFRGQILYRSLVSPKKHDANLNKKIQKFEFSKFQPKTKFLIWKLFSRIFGYIGRRRRDDEPIWIYFNRKFKSRLWFFWPILARTFGRINAIINPLIESTGVISLTEKVRKIITVPYAVF